MDALAVMLLGAVGVAVVWGVRRTFGLHRWEAVPWRALATAPVFTAVDFPDGAFGALRGVLAVDRPQPSPVSGRAAACWSVTLYRHAGAPIGPRGRIGVRQHVAEAARGLRLATPTGSAGIELARTARLGALERLPTSESSGCERVIEPGVEVAVIGYGRWEPDPEAGFRGDARRLVMHGTDARPLCIVVNPG